MKPLNIKQIIIQYRYITMHKKDSLISHISRIGGVITGVWGQPGRCRSVDARRPPVDGLRRTVAQRSVEWSSCRLRSSVGGLHRRRKRRRRPQLSRLLRCLRRQRLLSLSRKCDITDRQPNPFVAFMCFIRVT